MPYLIRLFCAHIHRPNDRQAMYINIPLHTDLCVYTYICNSMCRLIQPHIFSPSKCFLIYFVFVCYMPVCICMWLPSSLWVHTKAIGPVSTTSFLRQGLSFKLKLTNLARLDPRASGTCLSVTLLVLQTVCFHTWFVFGCWCSKLKFSCLCGRHWTY